MIVHILVKCIVLVLRREYHLLNDEKLRIDVDYSSGLIVLHYQLYAPFLTSRLLIHPEPPFPDHTVRMLLTEQAKKES